MSLQSRKVENVEEEGSSVLVVDLRQLLHVLDKY